MARASSLRFYIKRRNLKGHLLAVEKIRKQCFPNDTALPPLSRIDYVWLALPSRGFAMAYATAHVEHSKEGSILRLTECAVDKRARGRGLQRRLIRARENWGKKQGATVSLTYTCDNPASEANLKAAGYRAISHEDRGFTTWRKVLT